MEIVQKKGSVKHTFTLHDNYFNFAFKDKSGSDDVDINYADLPKKSSIQIEENEWLRNVGYLWMVLGLGSSIYKYFTGNVFAGSFWFWIGLGCVLFATYSKIKYTVFKTEKGSIFIIQDDKHGYLVNELKERRLNQLRSWYADINPENDLETEIGKFEWLGQQGALSKEEVGNKIAQVQMLHNQNVSSETLN
ncbi:hypothetical protein [Kangiella spongicola]|uniref:Uncharacterized protein n=1 Tax=Kangiella spongicola TaxID=796379 RepID=A0A318D2V0_9GAMM|nr:hypothetical protein [Kangiella spongicola]PXF63586.1 hypothetical protein DL796_00060 [Kangiella spongicola]